MVTHLFSFIGTLYKKAIGLPSTELEEKGAALNTENGVVNSLADRHAALTKKLETDFGQDDVWFSLYDACYTMQSREYLYKACLFQSAHQGGTSLGDFDGWRDGYTAMMFTNGQRCWGGPNRSARVQLSCGPSVEITAVVEPEKCVYVMSMTAPAACRKEEVDVLSARLEEQLAALRMLSESMQ
mmetsp:Transcript_48308/g.121627  ORF Transcript_48308/g.121627 Transcript_48308/m.121627 type:complete len:184 (+) Transcript_48308:211-762(+)